MPIYEYECYKGHQFEVVQSIKDEPLKTCREKGCRRRVRRLISKCSFALKGGGWYETDFKQGQKRNIADSGNESPDSKDSSESGASKSGKDESKKAESGKLESAKVESKPAKKNQARTG